MNKEIKAKIIELISDNNVVINKGKKEGVEVGMIFGVKLIIPDIVDTDDNTNILQGIFYEKGEIRIDSVFERMSFASLVPRKKGIFTTSMLPDIPSTYPEISGKILLPAEAWYIKVGDEVHLKEEKE